MKIKTFTSIFIFISFLFNNSCSQKEEADNESFEEICDCALMLDRYSSNKSEWNLDSAKKCILKYGNLDEVNREMVEDAYDMSILELYGKMPAVGKRLKKECYSNKTYSQEEIEIACDCWGNSFEANGRAFDNMSKSEQDLRLKCEKIFDNAVASKKICDEN